MEQMEVVKMLLEELGVNICTPQKIKWDNFRQHSWHKTQRVVQNCSMLQWTSTSSKNEQRKGHYQVDDIMQSLSGQSYIYTLNPNSLENTHKFERGY